LQIADCRLQIADCGLRIADLGDTLKSLLYEDCCIFIASKLVVVPGVIAVVSVFGLNKSISVHLTTLR
jgi:hypothetical protein